MLSAQNSEKKVCTTFLHDHLKDKILFKNEIALIQSVLVLNPNGRKRNNKTIDIMFTSMNENGYKSHEVSLVLFLG